MTSTDPAPAYLVNGDDASLVRRAAQDLIARLVGDQDAALVVETFEDDYEPDRVVDAARTPSMLGGRRILVARGIGQFNQDALRGLIDYLADPEPDATVVAVHDAGGRLNAALSKAIGAVGEKISVGVPHAKRAADDWWSQQLTSAPVRLDAKAAKRVRAHLGDDAGRLPGLLDTLAGAYGLGARVGPEEVEPFLGEAGSLKPWDLTDAIDAGNTSTALEVLARLLDAGGMHPLQVLALVNNHVGRAMRLDGSGAGNEREAFDHLGMTGKSTFPAKKALTLSRRLGNDGVRRAVDALATADLEIRGIRDYGGSDTTARLAVELAVIRLCDLCRR